MTKIINTTMLSISLLEENIGQIDGLPRNPRFIKDSKFERLKQSITANPEMLYLRECIVVPYEGKYVVLGGNQRYSAMKELGFENAPCKIIPEDTDIRQMKAIVAKDNIGYGEWDLEVLKEEWELSDIKDFDLDEVVGFGEGELDSIEDEDEEGDSEPSEVSAFGAHTDFMRFGEYKCEMTEEEFVWLRDTFQSYRRDNDGQSEGFINFLREHHG